MQRDEFIKLKAQGLMKRPVFVRALKQAINARDRVRGCRNKTVVTIGNSEHSIPCTQGWLTIEKDGRRMSVRCSCWENYSEHMDKLSELAEETFPYFVEKFQLTNFKKMKEFLLSNTSIRGEKKC